eukprot:scaffold1673_cov64-Phaeocystis_antarctica.AAC.3
MASLMRYLPSSAVCCRRTWGSMKRAPMKRASTSSVHKSTSSIRQRVHNSSFDRCRIGELPTSRRHQPWRSATIVAASRTQIAKALQHMPASASAWPKVICTARSPRQEIIRARAARDARTRTSTS